MMNIDPHEAKDVAADLIQTMVDMAIPHNLAIAALCAAIVMLGDDTDLDSACKMIDDFADRSDA